MWFRPPQYSYRDGMATVVVIIITMTAEIRTTDDRYLHFGGETE
jgi:hypothetical protein